MQDAQGWEEYDLMFQNNSIQEDNIKILPDTKVESKKIKYVNSTTQTDFAEEKKTAAATTVTIKIVEDDMKISHDIKVENHEIEHYCADSTTRTDFEEGISTDIPVQPQNQFVYDERNIKDANTEFALFVARELSNVPFNKRRNIMCEIIRIFEHNSV